MKNDIPCKTRGRPKGSDVEQQIIDKAGVAFVKNGYSACTVEHILEETGVSRTHFYRFFKNKEAVFQAIFLDQVTQLTKIMDHSRSQLDKNMSAEEMIAAMFETYLKACFSLEDLLPVIFQEQQSLPELRLMREQMIGRFKDNIKKLLKKHGYQTPDDLLVEGCLAAVDRMVLVESLKNISSLKKIEHVKKISVEFTSLLLKK